jgi:PAS domain S-box-containing protein
MASNTRSGGVDDPRDSEARPVGSVGTDAYRELFERSADAILIIENERFVDCNEAAVRMLRHSSREAVLRTHPSELSPPTQPDGRDSFSKANEFIALAFERGSHRFEWDHVRADGEVFPVEVLLTAVQEPGRKVLHVVWRDISGRRALEEELRHAQKMESIGRLAGGIAHDFNNSLVVVEGYADLLSERVQDDPTSLEYVAHIRNAGEAAAALVSQLLTFGRKQRILPVILNLNDVVADVQELLRPLLGDRVDFTVDTPTEPICIKADEGQLKQVFMNLAANAHDAMPDGGRFSIKASVVQITGAHIGISASLDPGDYAVVTIGDTGVGMSPDVLEHAFDPFFTTKGVGEGTGLGLSTVYGIVTQCGGRVTLASTPDHGTTFKIYLPLSDDDVVRSPQVSPSGQEELGTETILVAEDEAGVASLIVRALESRGYKVLLAEDGQEALDLYVENERGVSLILTDVMMPRMTGVDLVTELSRKGFSPTVLFMSGYTNHALTQMDGFSGEIDLVEKPFKPSELARRVRRAIDATGDNGLNFGTPRPGGP